MTQNINLYDSSLRMRREWLTATNAAAALGACCLVVVLSSVWLRHEIAQVRGPATETANALQAAQDDGQPNGRGDRGPGGNEWPRPPHFEHKGEGHRGGTGDDRRRNGQTYQGS